MSDSESLLAAGHAALLEGDWRVAHEAFTKAGENGGAEAHFGLASTAFWLGDLPETVAHLERAYSAFRQRPDSMHAAASALRLAFHYGLHLLNPAAAAGWLGRATRLVEEHALDPLRGELMLTRACLATDAREAENLAKQALAMGRDGQDPDLELCALAQLGAALVEQGRTDEGVALLDEAMAACLAGEARDVGTVALASCLTMVACANCADFERATQWLRAMEGFVERHGSPFHNAECRVVHADVLIARGSWQEAEHALAAAIDCTGDRLPNHRNEALASLADLRLCQGRLEEARRLLDGLEPTRRSVPALARLELTLGHDGLAAAVIDRRLALIGNEGLESGRLIELLGDVALRRGHSEDAGRRGQALIELGEKHGCRVLMARGQRLSGKGLAAAGDVSGRRLLDAALGAFVELGMPYEAARTRLTIAEASRSSDPELAAEEANAALLAFERLGARLDADAAAALLRSLGVRAARSGPRETGLDSLSRREREVLALLGEGLSNPVIARRLHLSRKTVEHHVAHVLAKLGLRNRAEAAAAVARELAASPSARPHRSGRAGR